MKIQFTVTLTPRTNRAFKSEGFGDDQSIADHFRSMIEDEIEEVKANYEDEDEPDEVDAEVLKAPATSEVLPIASAPKDGSRFLGGCYSGQEDRVVWDGARWQDGRFVMDGGGEPTHWMPKPELT